MSKYNFKANRIENKVEKGNEKYIFEPTNRCKNIIKKGKSEGISQDINKILRFNK